MKRFIALSLSFIFFSEVGIPAIAYASDRNSNYFIEEQNNINKSNTDFKVIENSQFKPSNTLIFSAKELKDMGFTEEEIVRLENYEMSGLYLIQGIAYNAEGIMIQNSDMQEYGKYSWAVKAIKEGLDLLPPKVKALIIGCVGGLYAFLDTIEHYTGKLEDAIYTACINCGMEPDTAELVTKTIMLFIF